MRTRPAFVSTRNRAAPRSRPAGPVSAGLPWLTIRAGALVDSSGRSLRLMGLHSDGTDLERDLRDLREVLPELPPGGRCVSLPLARVAPLEPDALEQLDASVAACADAGAYTLLRIDDSLWLRGDHVRCARRYANNGTVLFALLGREQQADELADAMLALRQAHPTACVWLPLESARAALAMTRDPQVGLLWNAAIPQGPRGAGLLGSVRAPVLLDGWQPGPRHALADARLMRLCRDSCIGWLVGNDPPLMQVQRGLAVPTRVALSLQRALLQSFTADRTQDRLHCA